MKYKILKMKERIQGTKMQKITYYITLREIISRRNFYKI